MDTRKTMLVLSIVIAAFVLGVAIWVRNPFLFLMVPLSLLTGYIAWKKKA